MASAPVKASRRRLHSAPASGRQRSPARARTGLRLGLAEPVEHVAGVPRRPVLVPPAELALVVAVRSLGLLQELCELFPSHVDLHRRPPSWGAWIAKRGTLC